MPPKNFLFKTTPFAHQLKVFEESCEREYFALLMEQGTGKSKVLLDSAAFLWNIGRINALVVIAPNGVHDNWAINEIPAHLPDYVDRTVAVWHASPTKAEKKALDSLFDKGNQLRILCMNVEAFSSKRGYEFCKRFVSCTSAMGVVDESTTIKNPQAARTKNILKLRDLFTHRRIATGTPVTKGPFDLFAPFSFLSEDIIGLSSFVAFKSRYAQLLDASSPLIAKILRSGAKFAPQIVATDKNNRPIYRNLDELAEKIKDHSFRVLKRDCLDLPDKLYQRRYYHMTEDQQTTYAQMRDRMKAFWGLESTTAVNKLVWMMRLQQIVSGYFPKLDEGEGEIIGRMFDNPLDNPKLASLNSWANEIDGKAIIFCRFIHEIEDVVRVLSAIGETLPYYGGVDTKNRSAAIESFQSGDTRFLVMNKTGARGLTLTAAEHVLIYTNEFDLDIRLQLEDRAHRIGLKHNVTYTDMECLGTIDTGVISNLRGKKNVADIITGDKTIEWL